MVSAQTPEKAPAPAAPAQGAAAPGPTSGPTPAEGYQYEQDGRRDPFLNLLGTGTPAGPGGKRNDGVAGMTVAEVSVRGVLESRGALIAMIEGPDKKTYVVHVGDKFFDGVIRSITPQGLVIVQEVNDPLSLVKQREIHKLLRSLESAKE
jgi:Tfp pilus assembly protein PilP